MNYDPERITFFAKTDARGKNVPFGIKAKDRTRHVYVIGKTGMGKSTLLENMAVQDIKNGEGFAFIDPHGQTAETLLNYIPEERMKDVLYFAPHDTDYPVSFNVMEDVGPDKRHLVVSGLMSVFKKIFVDQWSARMEYILQNTILALLEYPDSTLLGVNRMLSDKVYRKKVIDNITDPSVKSFWVDEFLKYNERYMQEAGDAIKNKIGQFTANPVIRNIIGQPKSSFDMRQIMDEKKILIMNLSKGLIGETNANLLGSMLTTRIYLAAMSRADLSPTDMQAMPNFYFYVDEFQSFANATFANILSEARKYKLNLTIAHQYIEQMEEDVRNAVFGNVGTTIAFRVGPFDAEILETVFAPKFLAVDICNLGFAQVYLSLMIDGIGSSPFSAVTLPPIELQGTSCKEMIIAESRRQFGFNRADVEKAILDWHGNESVVAKPKPPVATNSNHSVPVPAVSAVSSSSNRSGGNNRTDDRTNDNPNYKHTNSDSRSEPRKEYVKPESREVRRDEKPSYPPRTETRSTDSSIRPSSQRRPEQTTDNSKKDRAPKNEREYKSKPVNKTANLDELRSVLKNLSAQNSSEDKADSSSSKTPDKTPSKKAGTPESKNDLRSALSSVIGKDETKTSDTKAEVKEVEVAEKADKLESKKTPNPEAISKSVSTEVIEKKQVVNSQEKKEASETLDAKQLERMMRVGVNDKTPLK